MFVTSEAPLAREVFAPEDAPNFGANARALQFVAWKGVESDWLAPPLEFSVVAVLCAAQLVGLTRKPWPLIARLQRFHAQRNALEDRWALRLRP